MHPIYNTYCPDGFGTMSPYLFVTDGLAYLDFLQKTFYAEVMQSHVNEETGLLANAIVKIGKSCFMVSEGRDEFAGMHTSFYLYVNDVDALHAHAVDAGCISVFEPADMPYRDRQSGVIDPAGNYWWLSTRLEEKNYHD